MAETAVVQGFPTRAWVPSTVPVSGPELSSPDAATQARPTSITVIDDDPLHRGSIALVASQSSLVDRVEVVSHPRSHVTPPAGWRSIVVLALHLDPDHELGCLSWISPLRTQGAKVLVYAQSAAPRLIQRTFVEGADAVVLKREGVACLFSTIEAMIVGSPIPTSDVAHAILDRMVNLSPTEVKILELVRAGWDNRSIAAQLYLAPSTVNNCISATIAKFRQSGRVMHGSKPRVDLGEAAREQGIRRGPLIR